MKVAVLAWGSLVRSVAIWPVAAEFEPNGPRLPIEFSRVSRQPRSAGGKAWRLYRKGNAISLSPSVWRDGGCGSHFIVWQSRIIWCDRFEMGNQEPAYDAALEAEVLATLDAVRFRSTHEIAEELNEIPWDVARAARKLVDRGFAEYPADAQRDRLRKNVHAGIQTGAAAQGRISRLDAAPSVR
ncbi:DUF6527 family protein [Mesorhizobium sp. dw_380]|uniref:DUF6527 family protein n=1 Tax=Mesorhizobium sp. dw_380 TaxID=2812001 RepID=UPI001BDE21F5|nr:DUF6527 family protein [Mesorhizobium sp. dw_380]